MAVLDFLFGAGPLKKAAESGTAQPVDSSTDPSYLKAKVDEYMKQKSKVVPTKAGKPGVLPLSGSKDTLAPTAVLSTPSKGAAALIAKGCK